MLGRAGDASVNGRLCSRRVMTLGGRDEDEWRRERDPRDRGAGSGFPVATCSWRLPSKCHGAAPGELSYALH